VGRWELYQVLKTRMRATVEEEKEIKTRKWSGKWPSFIDE
jgi:hypothetical protein